MDAEWAARLSRAEQALRKLERIRRSHPTARSYREDSDSVDIAERNIQVVVEVVIDLANYLISLKAWPRAASATAAVKILAERRALAPRVATSVVSWVKTRNVIVHEYASIDSAKVHRALRLHLESLRGAVRALAVACGLAGSRHP